MNRHFKRIAVLTFGVLFIILGLIGLALPFLQGFLFLAIGIILLSLYSPGLREWVDRRTRPYLKLHIVVLKAESWVVSVIGRP